MTTEKRIELAAIFAARYIQESYDIHLDAYKRAQVCRAALAWADALDEIAGQDKPKTRYDWSNAPEWAQWAATDKNGNMFWFDTMPQIVKGTTIFNNGDGRALKIDNLGICEDWAISIEARPNA